MSRASRLPTRVTVALAGATAVVAAELAALALSVRLSAVAVDGLLPPWASVLPVVAVTVASAGLAVVVRRRAEDGAPLAVYGLALVVAAPVTAFGGGCGVTPGSPTMYRNGVRVGIAADGCVTFFNGALLVVGYALLAAGLWLAADALPFPDLPRLRVPRRPD